MELSTSTPGRNSGPSHRAIFGPGANRQVIVTKINLCYIQPASNSQVSTHRLAIVSLSQNTLDNGHLQSCCRDSGRRTTWRAAGLILGVLTLQAHLHMWQWGIFPLHR